MKKLFVLVFAMIIWQTNFSQNGWNRIPYGSQNQTFNQTITIADNGYTGTVAVPFPIGSNNFSWLKRGNSYYARCFWNNNWYEKLITNINWHQQQVYNQQFNQNWNCNITAPVGYNYLGYTNLNGNYYANFYNNGNYYRQPIGLQVLSIILNTAGAMVNQYTQPNWSNSGWNNWNQWNNNWRGW
jgi:hypothetical protein